MLTYWTMRRQQTLKLGVKLLNKYKLENDKTDTE